MDLNLLAITLFLSTAFIVFFVKADYNNTSGSKEAAIKGSGAYRQEFDRRMSGKTGFENTLKGIQSLQQEMQQAEAQDAMEAAARDLVRKKAAAVEMEKDQIYEELGPDMVNAMIRNNEEIYLNAVNEKPSIWSRAFSLVLTRSQDGTVAQDVSRVRALQGLLSFKVVPKPPKGYTEMYATGLQGKHIEDSVEKVEAIIKAEKKGKFNDAKIIYTPEIAYILGKLYMYGYQHRGDTDKDYVVKPDAEKAFEYFKLSSVYMNLKHKTVISEGKNTTIIFEDDHQNSVPSYMNNMIIQSSYEVIRCYRDGVGTKKDLALAKKTGADLFSKFAPMYLNRPAEFLVNTSSFKASNQTQGSEVLKRSGYHDVKDIVESEYRKIYYAEGSENRKAELKQQEEEKKKLEETKLKQAEAEKKQAIEAEKIAQLEKKFAEPAYQEKKTQAIAIMEKLAPSVLARVRGAQNGTYDSYTYLNVVKPTLKDDKCFIKQCYPVNEEVPFVLIKMAEGKIDPEEWDGVTMPALVILSEEISGFLEDTFKTIPKNPKMAEQLFLDLEKIDDSSEFLISAKSASNLRHNLFRPRLYFRLFQIYNEGIGVAKNKAKASQYLEKCIAHVKATQTEDGGHMMTHSAAQLFTVFCAMEAAKVKSQSSEMANLAAKAIISLYGLNRTNYRNFQNFAYSSVKGAVDQAVDRLTKQ